MKYLLKLDKYILYILILLFPIFVFPSFTNPFITPKLILLVFGLGLILLIKAIRSIKTSTISLSLGKFDVPILLIILAYTLSAILASPNKMESFFFPGVATFVIGGAVLYFIINQEGDKGKRLIKYSALIGGTLFSLIIIMAIAGIFKLIPQLPLYLKDPSFNTEGSTLSAILFLVPMLPIAFDLLKDEEKMLNKVILGVSLVLVTFGILSSIFNLATIKDANLKFPPISTSWIVAVETLKVSPILGVGPGNYLTSFNLFRPISYNQTSLWQVRFNSSNSFYMTILTETGILGLTAIIVLVLTLLKSTNVTILEKLPLVFLLILIAIFPPTPLIIVSLFIFVALATHSHKVNLNTLALSYSREKEDVGGSESIIKRLPSLIVSIPVILFVLYSFFFFAKAAVAESTFKSALNAISSNDGKAAYDSLQNAININPDVDRYHSAYAQVNLALANSISQKNEKDITDQDRQNVSLLIQQAIREGKVAVTLNIQRSGNWELLGGIYKAILNIAKDADQFAIQTYTQAIALDPINPNLRITLGGIYYIDKSYDNAIDVFKLAVLSKPDLANSHYNLAIAYKDKGDTQKALDEMNAVLTLLDKNSDDYKTAQKALDEIQKQKDVKPEASQNLTPPQGGEVKQNAIKEPISLPQEATPPATPKPIATPTPKAP